jgi:peptide alpha-N-acetyltransferase
LTLSCLDKKEEAYELVRKGLKHDLKSHVCWHVFGLLYRQDREYAQAVNSYKQALKIDPENMQILRDLSLLQIHRRDLAGFAETRRKLLQVKPSNRLNWVGYAIAEHLCKSYEFAWTCLDNYESTFKDENVPDYETSELFMYKASIMEEAGKFEEALDCVKTHDKEIVDKLGLNEMKARINMFLCRFDEAAELYRKLVGVNPENHQYVLGYMANQPKFQRFWPPLPPPQGANSSSTTADVPSSICSFPQSTHPEAMPVWGWLAPEHAIKPNTRYAIGCRQHKRRIDTYQPMTTLTDEEEDAVIQFFDELENAHPKSDALQRLILFFLAGARFEKRCDLFLRKRIRKGIPSLFKMIRPLYFQDGKAAIVEKLLHQYVKCLQEEIAWFGPVLGEDAKTPTYDEEEAPSCYLFSLMVLGEHYDFMASQRKPLSIQTRL